MAIKPLPSVEDPKEAPAEAQAEGAESEKPKLDARKVILFGVVPVFLLIGAGAGLYFSGVLDKFMKKGEVTEEHAEDGKDHAKKGAKGEKDTHAAGEAHFLQIPNMLVNLSTTDGTPRYLRLSVQLELASAADMAAVEAVMPRVVDQFQTYLRELRVKDLRGSAGIYRLQLELLNRVNAAAYPVEVKDVLFQEILIQ